MGPACGAGGQCPSGPGLPSIISQPCPPLWCLNSPVQAILAMCPPPTFLGDSHQELVSASTCPSAWGATASPSHPAESGEPWGSLHSRPIQSRGKVVCGDSPGWHPPAQALKCCWHRLRAGRARGAQGRPSMVLQPHPDRGIPKPALGYMFLQAGLRAQCPPAPTAVPNEAHLMTLLNDSEHFLLLKHLIYVPV